MAAEEKSNKIIGNESNMEYEIESGSTHTPIQGAVDQANKDAQPNAASGSEPPYINNDLATNDGGIVETLDTAFHNKPGVVEGENPSGSDRADYYESKSEGKSDAEEETDALSNDSNI